MAFFWPCGHEGQTIFDLLAKIQPRHIKRSNDWDKTLFFKKTWCCLLLNWVSYLFNTHFFNTEYNTQFNTGYSRLDHPNHHICNLALTWTMTKYGLLRVDWTILCLSFHGAGWLCLGISNFSKYLFLPGVHYQPYIVTSLSHMCA